MILSDEFALLMISDISVIQYPTSSSIVEKKASDKIHATALQVVTHCNKCTARTYTNVFITSFITIYPLFAGEQLLSPENHISGGDVTLDSVSPLNSPSFTLNETVPDFNLDFNLDEALKFVGLNCSETGETVWKVRCLLEKIFLALENNLITQQIIN